MTFMSKLPNVFFVILRAIGNVGFGLHISLLYTMGLSCYVDAKWVGCPYTGILEWVAVSFLAATPFLGLPWKKKKNYYLFIGNFSCYLKSSLSPKPFFILMNCLLLNLLLLILFSFSHKAYWDLLSFCSRPGLQELPWHSLCSLLQSYNKHFHQRFPYFHYAVDFDLGGCGLHKSQRELRCSASNCIIWFNLIFLIWKKILIKSRSF